mmetsp:Transcript_29872/g.26425  ORF Transcript_29872/g.26425 Transcript_29872/m.26425 type:complete len:84 (+) Transcript_29872:151-402(+)
MNTRSVEPRRHDYRYKYDYPEPYYDRYQDYDDPYYERGHDRGYYDDPYYNDDAYYDRDPYYDRRARSPDNYRGRVHARDPWYD